MGYQNRTASGHPTQQKLDGRSTCTSEGTKAVQNTEIKKIVGMQGREELNRVYCRVTGTGELYNVGRVSKAVWNTGSFISAAQGY